MVLLNAGRATLGVLYPLWAPVQEKHGAGAAHPGVKGAQGGDRLIHVQKYLKGRHEDD